MHTYVTFTSEIEKEVMLSLAYNERRPRFAPEAHLVGVPHGGGSFKEILG
jgi:hypothetical protein